MCIDIVFIFNSKIFLTLFNQLSPNFRRNLDLFTLVVEYLMVEAT